MKNTVGISHRLKRAWLDDLLDRIVRTTDERELRAFVDERLGEELPGKDARAKAAGILLRIWGVVDTKHIGLRDRAVALLPDISTRERIWLHWGMAALAYPFFRDLAEVIGRMLTLQDDISNAQVQARLKSTWGDRETSKEAAGKLITSMVDWEVLRATPTKGHFLLAQKVSTTVTNLQLWLLEAMLMASASEEIEANQLLRLPELFPFSFSLSLADLRRHDGFNIHRQGLDMDMVSVRRIRVEAAKAPAKKEKPKKHTAVPQEQATLFQQQPPAVSVPRQTEPHRALVIVRNLKSQDDRINMGEFVLTRVGLQYAELRKTFGSEDIFQEDWLLEKTYPDPLKPAGGIAIDIEDILFLLRLFKVGDIAFVMQAIVEPDGRTLRQYQYRIMNNLNGNSMLITELDDADAGRWISFANGLRLSPSWNAKWLSVARRYFLHGGAKEFNPRWDEVDRVVDYATALEATLVPEITFSRRRCGERAAALYASDPAERGEVGRLVKKLYDLRSAIVHGSVLSQEQRDWVQEHQPDIEKVMRNVLLAAIRQTPADDSARREFLRTLFDVADKARGELVVEKFRDIETAHVRKETIAEIAKLEARANRLRNTRGSS